MILQHDDRVLCDDFVFFLGDEVGDFAIAQDLKQDDITSGVVLTDGTLLLGHHTYAKCSTWFWGGSQYFKLKKYSIVSAGGC